MRKFTILAAVFILAAVSFGCSYREVAVNVTACDTGKRTHYQVMFLGFIPTSAIYTYAVLDDGSEILESDPNFKWTPVEKIQKLCVTRTAPKKDLR